MHLAWIGAHIQPVTADVAAAVGLPAAGLTSGDIVLRVGEQQDVRPRVLNQAIAPSAA